LSVNTNTLFRDFKILKAPFYSFFIKLKQNGAAVLGVSKFRIEICRKFNHVINLFPNNTQTSKPNYKLSQAGVAFLTVKLGQSFYAVIEKRQRLHAQWRPFIRLF
jgi:hypothetical protein